MTGNVQISGNLIVTGTIGAGRLPLDNKSLVINSADQVQIQQVTVAPPAAVTIFCDSAGVPKPGQLPRVLTPVVTRGADDLRATSVVSHSIAASAAIAATVNNAAGSADKGRITIGTGWSGPGSINYTVEVDRVVFGPYSISVNRQNDPPATTGGGSGGVKSGSDSTFTNVTSTAFAAISDEIAVDVGSGETVRVVAPLDYTVSANGDIFDCALSAKAQYQIGGGAWTDFPGSPVAGTNATWVASDYAGTPGSIAVNQQQSGLAAGPVKVRLAAALSTASAAPILNIQSGTMSVTVS